LYAVVIRTVDRFWLREIRQLVSWFDLAKPGGYLEGFVRRPRDPAYPDHVEISACPYAQASLVTTDSGGRGFRPNERHGLVVPLRDVGLDMIAELLLAQEVGAAQRLLGEDAEKTST
jgi:hypothetical protein